MLHQNQERSRIEIGKSEIRVPRTCPVSTLEICNTALRTADTDSVHSVKRAMHATRKFTPFC